MQFKHPEFLYALFLLLIPIIVHLFQLRRFKKVDFTNVAFLKKVTIQTRKSSQIKKWLTLLTRMLALACVILAFAQPFVASDMALNDEKETVIYIDNSFSNQAKGNSGPLLLRAIQDLYELPIEGEVISWFTNDETHRNVSVAGFKEKVLSLDYSAGQLSPQTVLLKADQLFSKDRTAGKRLIYISDFQQNGAFPRVPDKLIIDAVQLSHRTTNNIGIDSAFVESKSGSSIKLGVVVSSRGETSENVPVSLYNKHTLVAKTGVDLGSSPNQTISFSFDAPDGFEGRISVLDPGLPYDNDLYFSINSAKKIKVMSINEAGANYLQRLFDQEEFEYVQQAFNSLNYNDIPSQNFIILNELSSIPASLSTALKAFVDDGGSLLIIPGEDLALNEYNTLLTSLQVGTFASKVTNSKQVSNIAFDHPLYTDVFEKQVVNFQYPTVNSFYRLNSNAARVLSFEDGQPFIAQRANVYVVSAPINLNSSNFQNSPLIVPTFYNMAERSLPLPKLYYEVGKMNNFAVPVVLGPDEILTLSDSLTRIIPLQQTKANKVDIRTTEEPGRAGIYSIKKKDEFIENVSYNYSRTESNLQFADPSSWDGVVVHDNISDLFTSIQEANSITTYWKWFAIFALLFLLIEMLILKYYK